MIENYRNRLIWSDRIEFFNVIDSLKELRDDAAHILDIIEKNKESLEHPSGTAKRFHLSMF